MILTVLLLAASPAPIAAPLTTTPITVATLRRTRASSRRNAVRRIQVNDCALSGCATATRSPYRLPLPVSGGAARSTKMAAFSTDGSRCDVIGARRCGGRTHALVSADTLGTGLVAVDDVRFGPGER